jgi:hypothetical protein
MINYRNYFNGVSDRDDGRKFDFCIASEAPNSFIDAATIRAHCCKDDDLFVPNRWIAGVCLEFIEWAAEGMVSGDFSWNPQFEIDRFVHEYGTFINIDDPVVISPARWYADNIHEPWMHAAQDELTSQTEGYQYANMTSSPVQQIKTLAEIAIKNVATEMMGYLIDMRRK